MPESLPRSSRRLADVLYDGFFSAGIGGSVVALFFLGIDAWHGHVLFTPSLMGSVLFAATPASVVAGVRLDMVALYTGFHFVSFLTLGILAAIAVHEAELHSRHPALLIGALFVLLEILFAGTAGLLMPGVVGRLGVGPVAAANLLAALGMGLFLLQSHRPALFQRILHLRRA